jgi:DNA helicase-2/ATP-dependent DNA helicase PcrA
MTSYDFIDSMAARMRVRYTDEQRHFMSDFTHPIISFSSPGTGKTAAAIGGLLTAELYHKVPGKNIYALSFTNMAVMELSNRYENEAKKLGVRNNINITTLHKLCTSILRENHQAFGMNRLRMASNVDFEGMCNMLIDVSTELDLNITRNNARNILNAVQSLNSSLVFDREHVESKYDFKKTKISYEQFTKIRGLLYKQSKMTETIQVQDILLYTLELLLRFPEISQEFKSKCKVLLIDEFQDLSLLQLRIISLLSDTVIAIGDIKQQIYAFNGACAEIVEEFYRYFPTAEAINLTQSFRCRNAIASYATELIKPNEMGGEDFKGAGEGGDVRIRRNFDIEALCAEIERDFRNDNNTFRKDVLFLFRNNFSAIPIAEELYKKKVPFRVNRYVAANQIPIIKELCELCEFAQHPTNLSNIKALSFIIPEFKKYKNYIENPLYKAALEEGCSPFEVNFQFKEPIEGQRAMELLLEVREKIDKSEPLANLLNLLWPLFKKHYLEYREPFLEYPSGYYIDLVAPLARAKTYSQFVYDEIAKAEIIKDCELRRQGVRCYTFHAAKGLESDYVYIVSAEIGLVPNDKKLNDMEEAGCALEKAIALRNERSLVYVACTRARERLYISFTNAMSTMFSGTNVYKQYDGLYKLYKPVYPDVEAFEEFYGGAQ